MPTVAKAETVPISSSSFWIKRPISRTAAYRGDKLGSITIGQAAGGVVGIGSAIWLVYDLFKNWGDGGVFKRIALACTTVGGGVLTYFSKQIKNLFQIDLLGTALNKVMDCLEGLFKNKEYLKQFTKESMEKSDKSLIKLGKNTTTSIINALFENLPDEFRSLRNDIVRSFEQMPSQTAEYRMKHIFTSDSRMPKLNRYVSRNPKVLKNVISKLLSSKESPFSKACQEFMKEFNEQNKATGLSINIQIDEELKNHLETVLHGMVENPEHAEIGFLPVLFSLSKLFSVTISTADEYASPSGSQRFKPYVNLPLMHFVEFVMALNSRLGPKGLDKFYKYIETNKGLPQNDSDFERVLEELNTNLLPTIVGVTQDYTKGRQDVIDKIIKHFGLQQEDSQKLELDVGYIEASKNGESKSTTFEVDLKSLLWGNSALVKRLAPYLKKAT